MLIYRPGIAPDTAYSARNGDGSFQVVPVITDYTVPIFGYPNYGNNLRSTIYFTNITDLSNKHNQELYVLDKEKRNLKRYLF